MHCSARIGETSRLQGSAGWLRSGDGNWPEAPQSWVEGGRNKPQDPDPAVLTNWWSVRFCESHDEMGNRMVTPAGSDLGPTEDLMTRTLDALAPTAIFLIASELRVDDGRTSTVV